jgi:hypothetical protein
MILPGVFAHTPSQGMLGLEMENASDHPMVLSSASTMN